MTSIKIGSKAPSFSLPRDGGDTISLKEFKGQTIVLYFYPKDDTSGCTAEACDFNDNLKSLNKLNVTVIGVSKDSVKKHDKFKEKYGLKFILASDEGSDICEQYGVYVEKSMYGKKYMGIERTTFLIDGAGKIVHIWPKVKVNGHVDEVIEILKKR
jgi:peroxiredoxin Q/BCP